MKPNEERRSSAPSPSADDSVSETSPIKVSRVTLSAARGRDRRSGLLGFVSFEISGLRLEGVTIRRTQDGRLVLSFPQRRDVRGDEHALVRPIHNETRLEIERQVFAALGLDRKVIRP
jgi:DNA-binding cell septation regulator SpoVG